MLLCSVPSNLSQTRPAPVARASTPIYDDYVPNHPTADNRVAHDDGIGDASNFLCQPFAGRTDEDELFLTHSKFWDRAEVIHGVAAREAHDSARAVGYLMRAFGSGR